MKQQIGSLAKTNEINPIAIPNDFCGNFYMSFLNVIYNFLVNSLEMDTFGSIGGVNHNSFFEQYASHMNADGTTTVLPQVNREMLPHEKQVSIINCLRCIEFLNHDLSIYLCNMMQLLMIGLLF